MKKGLKKLTLSKETLLNLDDRHLRDVAGGTNTHCLSCITDETARCTVCPSGCTDC
jgi:hypothetical protein